MPPFTNRSADVNFDGTDPVGSGPLVVQTARSNGAFRDSRTVSFAGESEGAKPVSIRLRDAAGLISNPLGTRVVLDTHRPRTTSTRVAAKVPRRWRRALRRRPRTYTRGIRPRITVRATDALSGVKTVRLALRLKDPKGRCTWCNGRQFNKLKKGSRQCADKRFFSLVPTGTKWAFKASKPFRRVGRYQALAQAQDKAGNREQSDRTGPKQQITFKIIGSRGLRRR